MIDAAWFAGNTTGNKCRVDGVLQQFGVAVAFVEPRKKSGSGEDSSRRVTGRDDRDGEVAEGSMEIERARA